MLLVAEASGVQRVVEETLASHGHAVVHVRTMAEALDVASKVDLAAVVVDVRGGLEGPAVAAHLRASRVPVLEFGSSSGAPERLAASIERFVASTKGRAASREGRVAAAHDTDERIARLTRSGERRYADLADSMPQIVWTADATGRLLYCNARWKELSPSVPCAFADVVHAEDLGTFLEGWRSAIANEQEWEAELRFGTPSLGYRYHLVRATPRIDDAGAVIAWVGTSTDIDARVRAAAALRLLSEASKRLASVLDDAAEVERVLDSVLPELGDGARMEVREAGAVKRMFAGVTRLFEDARFDEPSASVAYSGRPEICLDVALAAGQPPGPAVPECLKFLFEVGVSAYMCLPVASRGRVIGTLTFVRTTPGVAFREDDVAVADELARRIGVALDNAQLHATTELRAAQLEQVNAHKDVFLATLSHELRTPLNAVLGWAVMLRGGKLSEEDASVALETIDRNARALARLVGNLLDVSSIVTSTLTMESAEFEADAPARLATANARDAMRDKGIVFEAALDASGATMMGDPRRFAQIFDNLLSNARKFTPPGGHVWLRSRSTTAGVVFEVEDDGAGIPEEFLPHVFERFRQADAARSTGLGLGLAIVRHLVEEQGGSIEAVSAGIGRGAKFTVQFPMVSEASEEPVPVPASATGESESARLAGVRVLVVEDDPDGNELITAILERFGAHVRAVMTVSAALDAFDAEVPDVLLSDIGLPDGDGHALIGEVRKRPGGDVRAIALTAYATRQDAASAILSGFDAHVSKPVHPEQLVVAVERIVRASVRSEPAASA